LKKLDTDYIDFYHMWGINWETYETKIDVKGGPLEAARKAKEEGLIVIYPSHFMTNLKID